MNSPIGLQLDSVTVDFPVYTVDTRSLKNSLIRKGTGGQIGRSGGNRVSIRALEDVSLTLQGGDRLGLVGANGAGKTTLLRVLAGIYRPTMGRIWRQGRVASLLDLSLGIESDATGYENIKARGLLFGLTPKEVRDRTEEIATFTELGDYLAMPIHTYSSGMRLRLAFAVCTCFEPEILVMDEWIGVGDQAFAEKAGHRLEQFVDRAGILVLASHNIGLIERICSKAALLDAGRIRACGPTEGVLREYARLAVG